MSELLLDAAGRRRSPATLPEFHAGRPPRNKGMRYPADPPTIEEIVAVMRHASDDRHGWRARAMIIVLWRVGLRIQEALALAEHDLDKRRGSLLVGRGKGGRRREVGMDEWGWEQLRPWLSARRFAACSAGSQPAPARARQPRHRSIYLQGMDPEEIIPTHRGRARSARRSRASRTSWSRPGPARCGW